MDPIEIVRYHEDVLAIIIRNNFSTEGLKFFTPDNFSQQLAYMKHGKGKVIKPHIHNIMHRDVMFTQEVLFVKKGKLKVDIYKRDLSFLSTYILEAGDVILLAGGGHAFEALEDLEMFEVKQGPYASDKDKVHFEVK